MRENRIRVAGATLQDGTGWERETRKSEPGSGELHHGGTESTEKIRGKQDTRR